MSNKPVLPPLDADLEQPRRKRVDLKALRPRGEGADDATIEENSRRLGSE